MECTFKYKEGYEHPSAIDNDERKSLFEANHYKTIQELARITWYMQWNNFNKIEKLKKLRKWISNELKENQKKYSYEICS